MKKHNTVGSVKQPQQINKPKPKKVVVVEKPEPKKKLEPLKLTYRWIGQCSVCGGQVETLDIAIRNDFFIVAWCSSCHKKLSQRKVVKL